MIYFIFEFKNETMIIKKKMAQLLDGNLVARELKHQLQKDIGVWREKQIQVVLAVILVGDHGPSLVYIRQKEKACREVGIDFRLFHLAFESTTEQVLVQIDLINNDSDIHGLIVQLPLPPHVDEENVIARISPKKDVDGFHPLNIGRLVLNQNTFVPATPYGIELMLKHYHIETKGKHCVIIGKSLIVGQPLMNLISLENGMAGTVTCCDRYTENLREMVETADLLIVAAGKHHLINDPSWLKPGVVIIDVGIHRIPDQSRKRGYRLEGDVNFEAVRDQCGLITPVPGGVGPMTVVALLLNTWKAYQNQVHGDLKR